MVQLGGLSDDILSQILELIHLDTVTLWKAGNSLLNKKIERACRVLRTPPSMRKMKLKKWPRMLSRLVSLQVLEVDVESIGERMDKLSRYMKELNRGIKELSMTFLYASALLIEKFGYDYDSPPNAYPRLSFNQEGSFDMWDVGRVYPELEKIVMTEPECAEEEGKKWFSLSALSSHSLSIFPPSLIQLDWTAQIRYDIHFSRLPKGLKVLNLGRRKRRTTSWQDQWLIEEVEREEEEDVIINHLGKVALEPGQSSLEGEIDQAKKRSSKDRSSSSKDRSSKDRSSSSKDRSSKDLSSSSKDRSSPLPPLVEESSQYSSNSIPSSSSSSNPSSYSTLYYPSYSSANSSRSSDWTMVPRKQASHQRRRSLHSHVVNTLSDAKVIESFPRGLVHLDGVSIMVTEHMRLLPPSLRSGSWLPHAISHHQPTSFFMPSHLADLPKSTISLFTSSFNVGAFESSGISAWPSALPRSLTELRFASPSIDPFKVLPFLPKTLTCLYGVTLDSESFDKLVADYIPNGDFYMDEDDLVTAIDGDTLEETPSQDQHASNTASTKSTASSLLPIHNLWPPRLRLLAVLNTPLTKSTLSAMPPGLKKLESPTFSSPLLPSLPPSLTKLSIASYTGKPPSQAVLASLPPPLRIIKVYTERPSRFSPSLPFFSFQETK